MRITVVTRAALCTVAALSLWSCARRPGSIPAAATVQRLRIVGSDTMEPLVGRLAEEFMKRTPGIAVSVEGGGTATGVRALIAGEADLCTASRTLSADEARELLARQGVLGICILCARDALSIYVNHGNAVENLTLEQVRALLTGRISSWNEVGGRAAAVNVYVREPNSGTRGFVQEQVLLGEPFAPAATVCQGAWAVANAVSRDSAGIGFGGLVFGTHVRHARIDGVAAVPDRVRDGSYPLARYLYVYAADEPKGTARAFVDFVLSSPGQRVVEEAGYIPLWDVR